MQSGFLKNFKKKIRNVIRPDFSNLQNLIATEIQSIKLLSGKSLANQVKQHGVYQKIQDAEFKVFSQFGDDGILQYLIHQVGSIPETFIEFGVQDYTEANTRFLLMNNNWKGLIMDGSQEAMNSVRNEELYWRYDLTAVCAFIDCENINELFSVNGFSGEIGLLSIDIDGNDYWVWEKIDVINPILVTVEYNSIFGSEYAVTIPYDANFYRTNAHFSNLYWGTSLKALCILAERKGYAFVGCNSNGNNAHFVRKDRLGEIRQLSCKEGYVESKFRESRNKQGALTFLAGKQRLYEIKDMPIYDIEKDSIIYLADLMENNK